MALKVQNQIVFGIESAYGPFVENLGDSFSPLTVSNLSSAAELVTATASEPTAYPHFDCGILQNGNH